MLILAVILVSNHDLKSLQLGRDPLFWPGRRLYAADGRFEMGNMQDWQHSAMYSAFMVSGLVDALGFYLPGLLPTGTEHVSPGC